MIEKGIALMKTFREKRFEIALLSPSQVVNWDDLDNKLLSPADVTTFYDEMWQDCKKYSDGLLKIEAFKKKVKTMMIWEHLVYGIFEEDFDPASKYWRTEDKHHKKRAINLETDWVKISAKRIWQGQQNE